MIESGITRGALAAQLALLIWDYAFPGAAQWMRAVIALLAGCLGALSAALQVGAVDLPAALPLLGQGLAAAAAALGLTAGASRAAALRRAKTPGETSRHGTEMK